uniref:hypothetical protein n=1 Tax=Enterocloster clostridioformis TaxID=1531 RepID=UPI0025A4E01C
VWSAKHGWMLVNTINHTLMLSNGQTIPFSDAQKLFTLPQLFSEPSLPSGKPLILSYLILSYLRSSNLLRYGWNPFLQTQICGLNYAVGIR